MVTFEHIQGSILEMNNTLIKDMEPVEPEELGLDNRSARVIYVGTDLLAVNKADDRNLQYYGGFEYVDSEFRLELGTHVYYSTDSPRVAGHYGQFKEVL